MILNWLFYLNALNVIEVFVTSNINPFTNYSTEGYFNFSNNA